MEQLSPKDMKEGAEFDLGTVTLSEQDIIEFAKAFDPLDFHTDPEAAKKSIFKGLVASGPHIFTYIHRTQWIPRFGHTVLAGLEVSNWKFLKPVYANQPISGRARIVSVKPNREKGYMAVTWLYEFKNEKLELVQSLEMTVLHKIA
jgi:acyl dehydratase